MNKLSYKRKARLMEKLAGRRTLAGQISKRYGKKAGELLHADTTIGKRRVSELVLRGARASGRYRSPGPYEVSSGPLFRPSSWPLTVRGSRRHTPATYTPEWRGAKKRRRKAREKARRRSWSGRA